MNVNLRRFLILRAHSRSSLPILECARCQYWKRAAELLDTLAKYRSLNKEYWQGRANGLLSVLSTSAATDPAGHVIVRVVGKPSRHPDRAKVQFDAFRVYGQVAIDIAQLILEVTNEVAKHRARNWEQCSKPRMPAHDERAGART